ncbi:cytidine and deoxycytidylate deaminase zinc-binding region [Leptospira alstonii serovar Pingchang str. 80-412]|uniref:Cytidine and deoxycytidylate deaminase zinc-binding region n=3 Tax=Leptospira alstonii TaxID=28452 RepID=M6DAB5_9LEPT|nr:cytidine and deoxycytidylate deaminase zinc-binding region [Leptospira alstonii serovar Sichuan str. 79601]EQA81007.1 cytidine and deoxycytidylate deaminase zinc-binding region [Leptospira alstonii serovar Pingchang str. 80-412]
MIRFYLEKVEFLRLTVLQKRKGNSKFRIHMNHSKDFEIILADFLKRMENLVSHDGEEIPSFTRIYHKNELISETFNEVEKNSDSSFHSEILCIRDAKEKLQTRYLTDCSLITSLEPCLMCAGTILLSRIPKVVYLLPAKQGEGISSLSIETIYSRNFFPELVCIPAKISRDAFKSFFKVRRKKFN